MCASLAISDMADRQSYRKQNFTTFADRPALHAEDLLCVCIGAWSQLIWLIPWSLTKLGPS